MNFELAEDPILFYFERPERIQSATKRNDGTNKEEQEDFG